MSFHAAADIGIIDPALETKIPTTAWEVTMKCATAPALIAVVTLASPAHALLSEQAARKAAWNVLKGEPYGSTPAQFDRYINAAVLQHTGSTICGPVRRPVWTLHINVADTNPPIRGQLILDANSGKLVCVGLPTHRRFGRRRRMRTALVLTPERPRAGLGTGSASGS